MENIFQKMVEDEKQKLEEIKKEQEVQSIKKETECGEHLWRLNHQYEFHCVNCNRSLDEAYY